VNGPSTASPGAKVHTFTGKPGVGVGKTTSGISAHSLPPDLPINSILSAYAAQADRPILRHQYAGPHAQSYGRTRGGLSVIDENEWGQRKEAVETRQVVFGPVYRQDRRFSAPSEVQSANFVGGIVSSSSVTHERFWGNCIRVGFGGQNWGMSLSASTPSRHLLFCPQK
jgi:hypothetical protein